MRVRIEGAEEHNLRGVDAEFGDGLTVVTGVSGSGKTSLVFDTLYHEAHRRFLDVFSSINMAERLAPARVRSVSGLGPAVAVGQNLLNRNPNSTLATAAGLHPFLRLLFARFGERYCSRCGAAVSVRSEDECVEAALAMSGAGPVRVLAPLVRHVRGSHRTLLQALASECGRERVLVDGHAWDGEPLLPSVAHDVAVAVATLQRAAVTEARRAVEAALAFGGEAVRLAGSSGAVTLATAPVCGECGTWFGDLEPLHFRSPCPYCSDVGAAPEMDGMDACTQPVGTGAAVRVDGVDAGTHRVGTGCERCGGTGMHPEAAAVRWGGRRFPEMLALTVAEVQATIAAAGLPAGAARLRAELERRLEALQRVGLGYVGLDRPSPTLSRGEAQRVRLAVALTSRLEDMLHILDEPTIGQHPADVARLLPAFRDLGGPVVYVEHDRVAAAAADHALDLGPGAGPEGGRVVFAGTPAELWHADTATGRYFSLRERVATPERRAAPRRFLHLRGCSAHNLRHVDVSLPLGRITAITGVSGSGKSTFVEQVLCSSLLERGAVGCREMDGPWLKPVLVDQDPIGRNPRSNPATYTKLADIVRDWFAAETGLSPSHFSFNRPEGACPQCQGLGATEVQMRYMSSTWVTCGACGGRRFSDEVLAATVDFGGEALSIAAFYDLPVSRALAVLAQAKMAAPKRRAALGILRALDDVGLGYLTLGQPSPTLSGGEAQRVKLARHLGRRDLAGDLLALDEPSTGLHPRDIAGLLVVLDRLARAGATIVVVEHNADIIRAADWVIDLGPGAGPAGGQVLYAGPAAGLTEAEASLTGKALREEALVEPKDGGVAAATSGEGTIAIRGARAHNLRGVDVDFAKGRFTVVTGVSGSGKSSLVGDVLETEARRRFLEMLSLYERQSLREGPESPADAVTGLGVAVMVGTGRRLRDPRATVGTATEVSHHLAALLATAGRRRCLQCGADMERRARWHCPRCGATAPLAQPRHFSPDTYAAACHTCQGVGTLQSPRPEKLIVHPERPLCGGAMHSPGFFPQGYLCKPFNGGYDMVQALAQRYGFDPATTPWADMAPEARHAFLFGEAELLAVQYRSRNGRERTAMQHFPGFYGWIRDWDAGGTYTATVPCPECGGTRLRPEYLAVTLAGHDAAQLSTMPLSELESVLAGLQGTGEAGMAQANLDTALQRLRFLCRVGLGYLHLHRLVSTVSAGEGQRLKLAGLLGSGLTSLTVLVDEPSRGLHPAEVDALVGALRQLRDEGNTVIAVEHDPVLMRAADHLIDMGPGPGRAGGLVVASGTPEEVARAETLTGRWLRGERQVPLPARRRPPHSWLALRGVRANNLRGEDVALPLGVLVGVCGVSGSGKSTLIADTLGRALALQKHTTSMAYEPLEPGEHDGIDGAPRRTVVVDQNRAGLVSPASYLELTPALQALYGESEDARALGLDAKQLARRCSVCNGSGTVGIDMGFLPEVRLPCETCRGSGFLAEAWEVRLQGLALPEVFGLSIDEAFERFGGEPTLARPLAMAREVGLGYLALRQPGYTLSGGETQRLKIARELCREGHPGTLYILDEPTVGQHLEDVARLIGVLNGLVDAGHSVLVVEHHAHLLATCDWLLELGPGGGPAGGRVVAVGTPEAVAAGHTATAPYLRQVLEGAGPVVWTGVDRSGLGWTETDGRSAGGRA
ncbi:MAG: excinuclease ABC subunit UvrA [Anaerolineae bacterium]